ncbi:MAG: DUF748 domain-containing protein, partial [Pseudomonadota bacterium]
MLPALEKFNNSSRLIKNTIYTTLAGFAFLVFTVFIIPAALKAAAENQIPKITGCKASIAGISFNPATLSLEVKGFSITEPDSDNLFLSFDSLHIDAEIVSLFKGGVVVKEISLAKPYIRLVRKEGNTYTISNLLTGKKEESLKTAKKPFLFSFSNLQITDGTIEFDDLPKKAKHRITELSLTVPLISNFTCFVDGYVVPRLFAKVNGKPFELAAKTKPFSQSLETQGELNLKDINLTEYLCYVPWPLNFKMPSGYLSTKILLSYVQHSKEKPRIIVQGDLSLSALEITSSDNSPVLLLPSFFAKGLSCTISSREVTIQDIFATGGTLNLARLKDGRINLQELIGKESGDEKMPPSASEPAAEPSWA